uniref:Uncharacterized protein n=1 Tax=Utricularia reniformis TaxID=192314 RepID=A0A1Y0B4J4_9LAMI|nr:hypothetical protein AEK19_MT2154 [Utricularia reniformis]ART32304.1 hypothetical protein AEK19_MT2154 [Utricularia reniformis]
MKSLWWRGQLTVSLCCPYRKTRFFHPAINIAPDGGNLRILGSQPNWALTEGY